MKKLIKTTVEVDTTDSTICDLCNEQMDNWPAPNLYYTFPNNTEYKGYEVDIDICEPCLIKMIEVNNISVKRP